VGVVFGAAVTSPGALLCPGGRDRIRRSGSGKRSFLTNTRIILSGSCHSRGVFIHSPTGTLHASGVSLSSSGAIPESSLHNCRCLPDIPQFWMCPGSFVNSSLGPCNNSTSRMFFCLLGQAYQEKDDRRYQNTCTEASRKTR